jgi:hypothetical protein
LRCTCPHDFKKQKIKMDATPSQRFMKKPPEKKTGSPERVSEGKNREEEEPTARPAAGIGGAEGLCMHTAGVE